MKKRIIALLLCVTAALSAGCGKDAKTKETQEDTQTAQEVYKGPASVDIDIDLEKQVKKLPDYKNIKVTITGDYDVTDEHVENSMKSLLPYYIDPVEVKDRDTVKDGDYVKVDYKGYHNDEAFEGGTAENVMLDVSNNTDVTTPQQPTPYIEGFCKDLVGAKIGDELDTEVTFPDPYDSSPDLAGEPVVFKISVKGIYTPVTPETLTDEMVKEAFTEEKLENREDLKEHIRDVLESQAQNNKTQASLSEVQGYMMDEGEVEIPEEYMEARLAEYQASFERSNLTDSQTMDDYLKENNTTLADLQASWREGLNDTIKLEFIFGRIADIENIQADEKDFGEFIQYIVDSSNGQMADADKVYEYYGNGNKENGEKMLRQMYRVNTAMSKVTEDADVTVKKEAETESGTQQ